MQVETIYTFKIYLFIAHPVSSHKAKSRRFIQYLGGFFNKTIIPLALVGYEMIIANSALRPSLAIIISYPTRARGIIVNYTTQPQFLDPSDAALHIFKPRAVP